MARVVVALMASFLFVSGFAAGPAQSYMGCAPPPPPTCGQQTVVTKMIPCVRQEIVGEVQQTTRCVPVWKVAYKTQRVMVRGCPIGPPCGMDPCTKCCAQPFCQVVDQKVPYYYCEYKKIPWYNVVYKPVCRPVMMPQQYLVEATPMCR
jgi:hypothetical protein